MELGTWILLGVLAALFLKYGGKNVFTNQGGGSGGSRKSKNSDSSN